MTTDNQVWLHLPEPPVGHPDVVLLAEAEKALRSLGELTESPDIRNAFVQRLGVSRDELISAANLVLETNHTIAFVGNIGVGKTTALCRVAGLEMQPSMLEETVPVLEVGGGGTTICEVHLVNGLDYGLIVEPRSEAELEREVREFARHLTPSAETQRGGETPLSREVVRAIRNMSGLLPETHRNPDGTINSVVDHARNLAEELADADALAAEIWTRMGIHNRTRREIWRSETPDAEPLQWVQENFKMLNYGQHPQFSLPRRVEVILPQRILGEQLLSIRVVDTKGIDGTAERADLEVHLNEPNTVAILCSSFNDAPAPTLQQLLERAVRARFPDLETKAAILVLPHLGQALDVKDELGDKVRSTAEGYHRKRQEVELQLQDRDLPNAPVEFFNVNEDDAQQFSGFLMDLVSGLRATHCARLSEVISDANALVQNYENVQVWEVQKQAARRLAVWLENNQQVGEFSERLQDSLFVAIDRAYASTLRASVRRLGEWPNLEYAHHLGFGTRAMAASAVSPKLEGFKAITANLLQDPELEDAFDLVQQARRTLEDGTEALLGRSYRTGVAVHSAHMQPDDPFWDRCDREWGQGSGYKGRVVGHHQNWFNAYPEVVERSQERAAVEWQQILERVAAILPSYDTES